MMNKTLGLYLHIPFCAGKCNYCDFYSLASPAFREDYTRVLCRELINRAQAVHTRMVDTVYVGGGTPTVLGVEALTKILMTVRDHYNLTPDAEITVEVNPATIDADGLILLRRVANRISMGVQSTHDALLARLGRLHSFAEARETVLAAHASGFTNISCDLMFGLPNQTQAQLAASIETLTALPITHLSLYALTVEPGTPFGQDKTLVLPDEDTVADMYAEAIRLLAKKGFAQYEISNFAKSGMRSRHNMRYWDCAEYLGFGPAAYSYLDGVRWGMPRDIRAYLATEGEVTAIDALAVDREVLTANDMETEYVMLRLRLADGINAAEFRARFGKDFEKTYRKQIHPYIESGHMLKTAEGWGLTPNGFAISNHILSDLLQF